MLELLLMHVPDEDHPLYTEIYEKYCYLARYISYLHLKKKQDIEDNVQETFLIVGKNFDEVKLKDEESLKGYICLVAQRSAISAYRKRQKLENRTVAYVDTMTDKITDDTFDVFNTLDIRRAMDKLNEEERVILQYKFVQELSSKEIGQILGISDAYARKKVERAKVKLRDILLREENYR